jgi:hypothetical protein
MMESVGYHGMLPHMAIAPSLIKLKVTPRPIFTKPL